MKKLFVLTFTLLLSFTVFAQFQDTVFSKIVGNIKFFCCNNQLSYPILVLNSGQTLHLHFDIMTNNPIPLSYRFIHCSWDWSDQDIDQTNFVNGYYTNDITNYQNSYNTLVNYVHYQVDIPNQNVSLTLSGNYIIQVFLTYNPDSILFQKRFFIVENQVPIQANVHRPYITAYSFSDQQVDFKINTANLNLNSPWIYTKAAVYQNFRPDRVIFLDQPTYYQGNTLIYNDENTNIFPGDNEYFTFSSAGFKFVSGRIYKYVLKDSVYHCYLLPDNIQPTHASYQDANGNFVVKAINVSDIWTQADYTFVHFNLFAPHPFINANVFVFGGLSNWKIKPQFKLHYDYKNKYYTGQILLKQGIYDYHYILVPNDSLPTTGPIEGNFFQTHNQYQIFIYYQQQAPAYDRIIGYTQVKSF